MIIKYFFDKIIWLVRLVMVLLVLKKNLSNWNCQNNEKLRANLVANVFNFVVIYFSKKNDFPLKFVFKLIFFF